MGASFKPVRHYLILQSACNFKAEWTYRRIIMEGLLHNSADPHP
ncbi:hypothetical protein SLEP1_g53253 [Rubroshorea leprosula]|uniref:Uncharacterized protein n=1 Tax=Rubroshorea leprosula TaxID=152421 RepID=A0AAV5MB77_9ROSI|nr:hypothetical protein SLEP1_g53253 [Rubroshorea leprosula]